MLACVKNNLAPLPPTLAFRLRSDGPDEPVHVEWIGEVKISADDILRTPHQERRPEALEEAVAFLRDHLQNGPVLSKEIDKSATALGIKEHTLKRAR
jgi:hypothetical protein